MAEDPQRNFRSTYYEKVGFRGVEEKKSLEILLKDNPLGEKLFALCLSIDLFPVFFFPVRTMNGHSARYPFNQLFQEQIMLLLSGEWSNMSLRYVMHVNIQ